jgi:HK97 family phage major capsid protein
MSKLKEAIAAAQALTTKPVTGARTKGAGTIAKLINNAPTVREGRLSDSSAGVSVQKAIAYCAGQIDETDPDVREAVQLSKKIGDIYGAFYPFENRPIGRLLVPASCGFLPTHTPKGFDIPGADMLRKEINQRILTVKGLDPDELRHHANGNGDLSNLATKSLNTLSDLTGGSTVAPPTLGDLIDLQRNLEVFSSVGATNVTLPPNGMMQYPKLTGGATAYWVGETASVTASQEVTGSLSLSAKKAALRVPLTVELMRFSDSNVDGMVRMDMARQGALLADLAQLQGTGGTQIKGLITYPTATVWTQNVDKLLAYSVTGAGSTFSPQDVAGMWAILPDEVTPNAFVMRKNMWAKLRNRRADGPIPGDQAGAFVFNGFSRDISDGGLSAAGTLDGSKVVWSSQVSATRGSGAQTYVILGYFPDWLVGRLGVMEFMVNPYSLMSTMTTEIYCFQFIDAGPRHAASFAFADAITIA